MSRLTKKDYKKWIKLNGYYTKKNAQRLTDISHKLGKLEDLMEEYNLESIEDLENLLALQTFKVGGRLDGKTIIAKGILYNQLNDELGCPLEVVFRAIEKGIVIKPYEDEYGDITLWNSRKETELDTTVSKLDFEEPKLLFFDTWVFSCNSGCYRGCVRLKDYQKTWWLKGEFQNEILEKEVKERI